jgi:hypothetical protein
MRELQMMQREISPQLEEDLLPGVGDLGAGTDGGMAGVAGSVGGGVILIAPSWYLRYQLYPLMLPAVFLGNRVDTSGV